MGGDATPDVRRAAGARVAREALRALLAHDAPDRRLDRIGPPKPCDKPPVGVMQVVRHEQDAQHAPVAPLVPLAHLAPSPETATAPPRPRFATPTAWVVAVVNLKGGSGKTTTAMHLAAAWQRTGERVMLIDADPQGSAVAWASDCAEVGESLPWPVMGRASPTLHKEMGTLSDGWDIVLLDCPPAAADHRVVRSAIRAADCVLVPCRPTAPDTRRVAPTRELVVDLAGEHDLDVVLAVLLTQTRAGTLARTAYRQALELSGVAVLDTEVPLRELFAWAEGSPTAAEAVDHYALVAAELDTLRRS